MSITLCCRNSWYLSVSGRIQESGDGVGHVGSSGIRAYYCYNRNVPHSEVCARCFRSGLSSNHHLYPCDCRIGADGGDYPEKVSPSLYQALGVFLPLITTNCCILGVAILVIQKDYDLLTGVVYAFSTAIGFGLALTLFAGLREQMSLVNVPKGMQGTPIALITAGLLAMAFMGFSGVVKL